MMKMLMRPDKSQLKLPPYYKYESGPVSFNKTYQAMFGYTDYTVLLIGGAGGRSGTVEGRVMGGGTSTSRMNASSGGGGGLLVATGKMSSLSQLTTINVGLRGANGTDANNGKATDGSPGGNSSFHTWAAYGGRGGIGGTLVIGTGGIAACGAGQGGNGGGNSAGVGTPGQGAITATAQGDYPAITARTHATQPTEGTATLGAAGSGVLVGGGGGGAGAGRVRLFDEMQDPPSDGAAGSVGLSGSYDCPGQPALVDPDFGGPGGGADPHPFVTPDAIAFYGVADTFAVAGGLVLLKIT